MQLRVLGEVEVVGPQGVVPLGGLRQRLLLAVLLAQVDQVVGLDHLIEGVWPAGDLPADPAKTLRIYVTRLRKALDQAGLPSSVLTTRDNGYLLSAGPAAYDAGAFAELTTSARRLDQPLETTVELLERALSLWHGPAFGDLGGEHAFVAVALHLDEQRLTASEELATARIAIGDAALVVADLELLVARHPLRERLRRLLMDALSRCGRRAEALRVFEDYRRLLRTELGVDPSPELRAAEADLLAMDGTPAVEAEAPHRNVRGYKLFERIGEGAFSVVYRAKQPEVGRDVAVKIIRSELANRPEFIRRFEAEAQLVARLEHPNIVPLYDFWREPARAYLVMRWLRAGSLESHLDRGPWSLEQTARLVTDVGSALASAHRAGVTHRDVRPANILLDEDGNAYLSDFGIAFNPSDARGSPPGASHGSPAYAPPEQMTGGDVGPAADVYSLAVTVFEALAGRLPFANAVDATALADMQLHQPIPRMTSLRPDLPRGIDALLATATAKSPSERHRSVDEFVNAFGRLLPSSARSRPRARHLDGGRNPYRGLLAFQEADADLFFGRDMLVEEMLTVLRRPPSAGRFLAVVGASGSGKSSVVRAGLIPALRRGAVAGADTWFFVHVLPGADPFAELAAALLRVMPTSQVDLVKQLSADADGIRLSTQTVLPKDGSELVVVIDQFEELFTRCDPSTCARFLDGLVRAVNHDTSRLRVVITLRADFLDHPLRHAAFAPLIKTGLLMVTPLSAGELEQAIVEPARRVGVRFQEGLVAEIVADVANRPAALPLLQFALHQLCGHPVGGELTIDMYRRMGGVTGALTTRAEAILHGSAPLGDEAARRLFGRLVTLGDGGDDTRRRTKRSELADDNAATSALIDEFGAARLLSFDRDPTSRSPTVEIAHEALLKQWPRLADWISDDRASLRTMRQIADAAAGWETRRRDPAELYRGGRLEDALSWHGEHALDLNEPEVAFLAAARAQRDAAQRADQEHLCAQQRTNRRLRRLLATVATVAVIALLAGLVAIQQRSRATRNERVAATRAEEATHARKTSETRRLGVEAAARAKSSPQLALLLGAEAYRREPGPESLGALQRALTGTGNFLGVMDAGRRTNKVQWLDGGHLAVAGADGVFVQELATGRISVDHRELAVASQRIDSIDGTPAVVPLAAFFGDRAAVTVEQAPKEVRVVRLDRSDVKPIRLAHDDAVQGITFSPDGTAIATIDAAGRVRLFDAASGERRWMAWAHPEFVIGELKFPAGLGPSESRDCDCIGSGQHVVAFAADGATVVSVQGPVVRFWETATGQSAAPQLFLADETPRGRSAWSESFHVDLDGSRLVVAGKARVGVFDLGSGDQLGRATSIAPADSHGGPWISDVAWLDEESVITLTSGGQIVRLDVASQQPVGPAVDVQLTDAVDLAVSPGGDRVAVASSQGIGFWSLRGDRLLARAAPRSEATVGSLSPGGRSLTAFKGDGLLDVSETVTHLDLSGPTIATLPVPPLAGIYRYFDQSPLLFSVSPFGDVTSWDPVTGDRIAEYDLRRHWTAVAISADGMWITFGVPGLRTYDARSGSQVALFTTMGGFARSVSFSPDRKRLTVADAEGKSAKIFDVATMQLLAEIDPSGPLIVAVRYSPDGSTLATVDSTGRITLRDPLTLAARSSLVGSDEGAVNDSPLWFSSDGKYLLSASPRQAVLWDIKAAAQIGDPFPNDASFKLDGVDGPHLLTAVDDWLLVWNLDTAEWATIACRAAGRNLTAEEWLRFGPANERYAATCPQWPALG